jgi:neutral ceramidase
LPARRRTPSKTYGFELGYGTVPLVPRLPFPLAGTAHPRERLSGWVDDPPQVTAVVVSSGSGQHAVIGADILIIDHTLLAAVEELASARGIDSVFLYASHTHSSMGGYLDSKGGRFFMGQFRPALKAFLLEQITLALEAALADASPVTEIRTGRARAPGVTMNRRRRHGPTDDMVLFTEFQRKKARPVAFVGVSGHPVIACFMDPSMVSSDYPGRVRKRLLEEDLLALIIPGALGGLNTIFPELPTAVHDHLDLVTDLMMGALNRARQDASLVAPGLEPRFGSEHLAFRQESPPLSGGPPLVALRSRLSAMIGKNYARWTAPGSLTVPASVFRCGPICLAGMPADFGVAATLLLRDQLERDGSLTPYVVSHANGYVGYLHLREEARWQESSFAAMHHYENAMAWYGRDAAERLMSAAAKVHLELA